MHPVRAASLALFAVGLSSCAQVQAPLSVSEPVQSTVAAPKASDCIMIEDRTKERLDCYDTLVADPPEPRLINCRTQREQDARLVCYNTVFVVPPVVHMTTIVRPAPILKVRYVRRGRGGCGSRGGPGYRLPNGKCAGRRR